MLFKAWTLQCFAELTGRMSADLMILCYPDTSLLLPGAELSLIAESFGFLNDLLLPFLSILGASCQISDLHFANVLFDVILPSVLGSSL